MPDGPGAAPRLVLLKLRQKVSSSRSNGRAGVIVIISGEGGSLGAAGRRAGFLKAFNVFLSPGANPADSRACRAADSSPIIVNFSALTALPSVRSVGYQVQPIAKNFWNLVSQLLPRDQPTFDMVDSTVMPAFGQTAFGQKNPNLANLFS